MKVSTMTSILGVLPDVPVQLEAENDSMGGGQETLRDDGPYINSLHRSLDGLHCGSFSSLLFSRDHVVGIVNLHSTIAETTFDTTIGIPCTTASL
nr:hypothetical protein CFP56_63731 [Quercus suber]